MSLRRRLKEFETSLRNNPNRYRSFAGAAKAAERAGDRAQARSYYEKLVSLCGQRRNRAAQPRGREAVPCQQLIGQQCQRLQNFATEFGPSISRTIPKPRLGRFRR